jgi:TolA-binding protein
MQYTLKKAMTNGNTGKELHADLTQQYEKIDNQRSNLIKNCFVEGEKEKFVRLATEFETCNKIKDAEQQFVNYLVQYPQEADMWYKYA